MSTSAQNAGAQDDAFYALAGANLSDLTARPEYRGQVDAVSEGVVSGWCVSTRDPLKPVGLELWIGETRLAAFDTGGAREDIEKILGIPVRPAFRAAIARPQERSAQDMRALLQEARDAGAKARDLVSVRVSGQPVRLETPAHLDVSFDELAAHLVKSLEIPGHFSAPRDPLSLRGFVDSLEEGAIGGWCLDLARPHERLQLEFYFRGILLGVAATGGAREDISRLLKAPTAPGFAFSPQNVGSSQIPALLAAISAASAEPDGLEGALTVKVAGADSLLPFTPGFKLSLADLNAYARALSLRQAENAQNRRIGDAQALLAGAAETAKPAAPPVQDVRVVAFYLPQFHPFAENDEWWGEGFTEWSNVAGARPQFSGHNQPRIPADLGYYDLRLDAVHEKQTQLARQYNISGFCYYYYSFNGKMLMTMPIERHFEKNYELDFCLCWANENWSRRWDGSESDVLLRQSHSETDDDDFIDEVIKYFHSPRYIKIGGAPLLLVYRLSLLAHPAATIAQWKRRTRAAGFPDLHVSMCETFGLDDPLGLGADSACQFPPHGVTAREIAATVPDLDKDFTGKIYDYVDVAAHEVRRPDAPFLRFRTAMPAWDNTSRKGRGAHVFHNASPAVFEAWLSVLCSQARRRAAPDERLVFVNAWNEWAEGAYLEPDRQDGRRHLKAVQAAQNVANLLVADAAFTQAPPSATNADLVKLVSSLANANQRMLEFAADYCASLSPGPSPFVLTPSGVFQQGAAQGWTCNVESIDGRPFASPEVTVDRSTRLWLKGWVRAAHVALTPDLPVFMQLVSSERREYVAAILERFWRPDVCALFNDNDSHHHGFNSFVDFRNVEPGVYRLRFLMGSIHDPHTAYAAASSVSFLVG